MSMGRRNGRNGHEGDPAGSGGPWRWVATERPRPARVRAGRAAPWLAVGTVCFGAFMGQLDASIVTLAFPALHRQFAAPLAAVQWVSLAYLVTLVTLLIPAGRVADAAGRKLVYLYGFVVFTVASAACGLAPSLGALVGFRVLQAVGAAMLQANSVALVTTSVPRPRARLRAALGVQAGAQALGLALGPTLGGLLVATVGWRWVFAINVPVGVVAVAAGRYLLPRTRERTPLGELDWPGLVLLTAAATAGLLALSAGSGLALPVWAVLALGAVTLAAAGGFVRRERRAAEPLLDLTLLGRDRADLGLVGALGGYLVLFGPLVLVPVVLTNAGVATAHAGLVLTALPAGFAAAATAGGRLRVLGSDRRRHRIGALLAAAALGVLAVAPLHLPVLAVALAVVGLGLGVFTPANNAMIMAAIPARASATGGGLVNLARGLGTALGVALPILVLHLAAQARHPTAGPHLAMGVLLLVTIATMLMPTVTTTASRHHPTATGPITKPH
ncbi:MAG TPA: MFS transporter [Actinomycetes bacterium]|nr:MFS transporter [Actinomycetes bacterium]